MRILGEVGLGLVDVLAVFGGHGEAGQLKNAPRGIRQSGPRGGISASCGSGAISAPRLRSHDFAFERLAGERLPFLFLIGRQHGQCFFGVAGAQFLDFLHGRLAIAAGATLESLAQFSLGALLNVLELFFLIRGEFECRGHLGIGQGHRAALLQGDLLEAFDLVLPQDAGDRGIAGLRAFRHFRLAFFAAQIAQIAARRALFVGLFGHLFDLILRELQFGLDGLLVQQVQAIDGAEATSARTLPPLGPNLGRRNRHDCQHED
jgi:hypothetical protein